MNAREERTDTMTRERVAVATFILLLLGASFLVAVVELVDAMAAYVAVVGIVYALLAVGLLWRVLNAG